MDPSSLPPANQPLPAAPGARRPSDLGRARRAAALGVALLSDGASIFFELIPALQWALDVGTALVLFALVGFHWPLLPVLIVEAIPGLAVFPTWTLAAATLVLRGGKSSGAGPRGDS